MKNMAERMQLCCQLEQLGLGDSRLMNTLAYLGAVTSEDGMTADYFSFPKRFLDNIPNKIVNNVKGINRCV